jgi:hypothetical protein
MKQKLIIKMIEKLQVIIILNRNYGFWLVSLLAFSLSPFITNDGLCLLLVTPVLDAFIPLIPKKEYENKKKNENENNEKENFQNQDLSISNIGMNFNINTCDSKSDNNEDLYDNDRINEVKNERNENDGKIEKKINENCTIDTSTDRFYFMLAIACSSNIGMYAYIKKYYLRIRFFTYDVTYI